MRRTIALAVAAAFILGGCSKGPTEQVVGQASTPVPTSTPRATPTPVKATPTPLTIAEAAKAYLAGVTPRNKAAAKWSDDLRTARVKTLRADAVRARAAERHFLEVLDNTLWPAVVAKNAASLSTCTAAMASWFDQMTHIANIDELTAAPDCGGADSQLIRARLHLSSETN